MIKIYYADISNLSLENHLDDISEYRKEKLNKIKPALSLKQSLGAELLLNEAVRNDFPDVSFPLNIKTGEFGKPYCEEIPFFFCLSHSGDFAACAISENEIGLDIQKLSAYKENLVTRNFTPSERDYIENSDDRDIAFTKIWTGKESYIKALGTGLRTALNSFSVWPERVILSGEDKFCIHSGIIENFFYSVCVKGENLPEVQIIKTAL